MDQSVGMLPHFYVDLTKEFDYPGGNQIFTRGKFILVADVANETLYLIRSPIEWHEFHANILEHFLNGKGVAGSYNQKRDDYSVFSSEWKVEGGGYWDYEPKTNVISVYGRSLAYGPCDNEFVKRILEESNQFSLVVADQG